VPSSTLPFDRVVITEDKGRLEYTAARFIALPIHLRIGWLLQSRIAFFMQAEPVDKREALLALRRYESGKHRKP
jgi:hypothetical protein